MLIFAVLTDTLCAADIAIKRFLNDEIFEDSRLRVTRNCFVAGPLIIKTTLSLLGLVLALLKVSTGYWFIFTFLNGFFALVISADAISTECEGFRRDNTSTFGTPIYGLAAFR